MRRFGYIPVISVGLVAYLGQVLVIMMGIISPEQLVGNYFEFLFYWILGACAVDMLYRRTIPFRSAALIAMTSFCVWFAYAHFVSFRGSHVVTTFLFAVAVAAMLYCLGALEAKHYLRGSAMRIVSMLGKRSYSLYAVHTPIIALAMMIGRVSFFDAGSVAERWITLACVIVTTGFYYRLIERPSHDLSQSVAQLKSTLDAA